MALESFISIYDIKMEGNKVVVYCHSWDIHLPIYDPNLRNYSSPIRLVCACVFCFHCGESPRIIKGLAPRILELAGTKL